MKIKAIMQQIIVFTCFFFLSACENSEQSEADIISFTDFPNEYIMEKPLKKYHLSELAPTRIYTIDSLILIWHFEGHEYFGSVYNENLEIIGSFGLKGKGEREFPSLYYCGQYEKDTNNNIKLWVHDMMLFKAFKIDLFKALNNKDESFIEKSIQLPSSMLTISDFFIDEKNQVVLGRSDMVSNGRYFYYNLDSASVNWVANVPDVTEFANSANVKLAYHASSRYLETKKQLVSAMTFFDRIDFISTDGHIIKSCVKDNRNDPPNFLDPGRPFHPENRNYCVDLHVNSEYIFKSLNGLSRNEKNEIRNNNGTVYNQINVYTIDGKPIANLKFDFEINRFTVDKSSKYLYAMDFRNENVAILKYRLPNFISK